MAESGMGKSQVDVDSLKETLCAQQRLLQKLYHELDAEREASSTAASEALSMILRLQGEKAAVKMEAEQYKRMVEEKMCHAEESLAIFEDIMYQKEMEVASLDYQVQAYRHKLISMGFLEPGIGEIKFPENLLQRSETVGGDVSLPSIGRRNSLPIMSLKLSHLKKGANEKEGSLSPERDVVTKTMEDCISQDNYDSSSDWEKKTDSSTALCINSYWEQIKKLDGRVKEIAGVSYANLQSSTRSPSPSPFSQLSSGNSCDATKGAFMNEMDQMQHHGETLESEIPSDSACSPGVLDVFEVPQTEHNNNASPLLTRNREKMVFHGENKPPRPNSFAHENVKSPISDESDWKKTMLKSCHCENNFRRPSDAVAVDCSLAVVHPTSSVSETHGYLNQLNKISEIVEAERLDVRQESTSRDELKLLNEIKAYSSRAEELRLLNEIKESNSRDEELRLLNEMKEQLNLIHCEIRRRKTQRSSPRDDLSFVTLQEAMLHFWL